MSTSKKKAAGLSALKNLSSPGASSDSDTSKPKAKRSTKASAKIKTAPPSPAPNQAETAAPPSPAPIKSFNLNLPLAAHKKLREIAFHEEDSITSLILDGIDLLFVQRGLPPIANTKSKNK